MVSRKMKKGLITLYKMRNLQNATIKRQEAYKRATDRMEEESSKLFEECDHFIVLNLGRDSHGSKQDELKCAFCGASYEKGNRVKNTTFKSMAIVDISKNKFQGVYTQEQGSLAYNAIVNYIQNFGEKLEYGELKENLERNCDEIIRMYTENQKDKRKELYLPNKKPSFLEDNN